MVKSPEGLEKLTNVVGCTVIKELCNTTVVVIDVGTLVLHSNGNLRLDQ